MKDTTPHVHTKAEGRQEHSRNAANYHSTPIVVCSNRKHHKGQCNPFDNRDVVSRNKSYFKYH
eukprot:4775473-Amphidinium_carterae.1